MNNFEVIIRNIVRINLGSDPRSIQPIKGGKVGKIFVVKIPIGQTDQEVIVKLVSKSKYKELQFDDPLERIYGVNGFNFRPAYNLLEANGLVIPKVLAEKLPDEDSDWGYQIMERLEGVSIREFLQESEEDTTELHRIAASEFARVHKIVRKWDGWVEKSSANKTSWGEDFLTAIGKLHKQLADKDEYLRSCANLTGHLITELSQKWEEPNEFVLSNKDGFQGMAKNDNGLWKLTGLLDIEDHKFIDQRMVLAGYELPLYYKDRQLPDVFLSEYSRNKPIPDSYFHLKKLFMLFYVFYWLNQEYNRVPNPHAVTAHRRVLAKLGLHS